ncbi:MAG: DUF7220 family protein [Candidatus Dormibacteria bacterium]
MSLGTQLTIFPLFHLHTGLVNNIYITLIFTSTSILRGFCVRRLFNWIHRRNYDRTKR